jgi:hypothetical protein
MDSNLPKRIWMQFKDTQGLLDGHVQMFLSAPPCDSHGHVEQQDDPKQPELDS